MKRKFILPAVVMVTATFIFAGCQPSRVWATKEKTQRVPEPPPPRYYNPVSLIISPTPGFTMNRYPDGRYYHRGPQGFLYWKGYDNRFYLDKSYISRVSYSKWEYEEWKRYSREARHHNGRY